MRKIAFRAWDSEEKNFIYFDALEGILSECDETYRRRCVGQFEQFTGLHDKNDKEIYEGDILENPDHEEAFVVEYHEGMAGYIGWGDDKIAGCYLITGDEIEIIGNIHENPELLNDL